jgi:hypothetical protein
MRDAYAATGGTSSTVLTMTKRLRVSEANLRRWAAAIGEPVEHWLAWGGYEYVSPDYPAPHTATSRDNPIELLLDEDERKHQAARAQWEGMPMAFRNWHLLTPEQRERLTRASDEILKEPPGEG